MSPSRTAGLAAVVVHTRSHARESSPAAGSISPDHSRASLRQGGIGRLALLPTVETVGLDMSALRAYVRPEVLSRKGVPSAALRITNLVDSV